MRLHASRAIVSAAIALTLSLSCPWIANAAVSDVEAFSKTLENCDPLTPGVVTRRGERVGLHREEGKLRYLRVDSKGHEHRVPETGRATSRSALDALYIAPTSRVLEHEDGDLVLSTSNQDSYRLRSVQFAAQGTMLQSEWQAPLADPNAARPHSITLQDGEAKLVIPGAKSTAELSMELASSLPEEQQVATLPSPQPVREPLCSCAEPKNEHPRVASSSSSDWREALADLGVSFGGQLSWVPYRGKTLSLGGADLALTYSVLWGSVGFATDGQERYLTTIEAGGYLLVNGGLGVSVLASSDPTRVRPHLFLGLPLPIPLADNLKTFFFVEPYYRPTFPGFVDSSITHEYGLLIKLYLGPRQNLGLRF